MNTCYINQNLSKKPSVIRAPNFLQAKHHFLSKTLKNPKGGPFSVKKFFVSDFAQISCVEFLGPKYASFWISSKSETNFFFGSEGSPLWIFQCLAEKVLFCLYKLWSFDDGWFFWQILIGITCIHSEKLTDLLGFLV